MEEKSDASGHVPVLLPEVLELLQPGRGGIFVDATLGLGGHAEALLDSGAEVRLVGIDRDPDALALAGERLARFGSRVSLVAGRHEDLAEILDGLGVARVDGVLADLGVSSMQLDRAERGFSFMRPGPLDMRMSRAGRSASDLVRDEDRDELERIFWEYGEEPMAGKIARLIVEKRKGAPIDTTDGLRSLVHAAVPRRPGKIDPATRVFQALRIATNQELTGLTRFLDDAIERLSLGSRLTVLSYHSLEDRIVKRTFARHTAVCTCPPSFPACVCARKRVMALVTRQPIRPSDEEVSKNPRSRSARLRAIERTGEG
ncbi:MAG: 16S rRNA (cytosine(1402)-N(4))-methyltransferase RsmH [Acidobacteria bacterium]|nr:16S rRNA (cytosine(1402)-N(4))-methyltransferase RsmH [Acidobacteriota bacterium]MCG3194472.1 Ribosomal RNA small subunit methyltransferase H [Thermoanaerobaculia bacterium]MCK6683111.1 16S rRNA (cytosine(1402)-N(4))-methyltransferase RsmH [Thermoanaerobaculia bacterium]